MSTTKKATADLRFRRSRNAPELLGQVDTPIKIGAQLVKDVPRGSRRIVDLGAGDGRLAKLCLARCKNAQALLVETDEHRLEALMENPADGLQTASLDILRSADVLLIPETFGAPDVVVSNPPYTAVKLAPEDVARVRDIFPFVEDEGGWVRSDVAFAAYAWALSQPGTALALILPAPAITQTRYRALREKLVFGLTKLTVTQLPSRAFTGVEVAAFLVTGVRAEERRRKPQLSLLDSEGRCIGTMRVSTEAAISRLDYSYHESLERLGAVSSATSDTLESLGVEIIRGSLSRNDFVKAGLHAFHTTDFDDQQPVVSLSTHSQSHRTAEAGDILIPRVGSRCLTKVARVGAGSGVYTDCVLRLRAKPEVATRVWKTLRSDFGREWRMQNAEGSCAKHLPLWLLKTMPVLP